MEGIAEVRTFFEKNKDSEEVKGLIASFAIITPEAIGKYIESEEGFKILRPHFDRYAEKAIKTHDEKKRAEIDEEISKKVAELGKKKDLTVAEEVAEIRKTLAASASELARERILRQLEAEAASRKLVLKDELDIDNPKLTLESGIERLDARVKRYAEVTNAKANELLAGGFKPGGGAGGDKKGPMTFSQYAKLPQAERIKMVENGEAAKLVQG